jgi:hypothetical protein
MQTRYVWRIVRDVRARGCLTTAGGRRVTPHALRRTFATEMVNRGVRLQTVSRLLGHAATTIAEQAYAQLTDHRIRTEVENALSMDEVKTVASAKLGAEVSRPVAEQPRAILTFASSTTLDGKLILRQGSRTDRARDQQNQAHDLGAVNHWHLALSGRQPIPDLPSAPPRGKRRGERGSAPLV